MTAEEVIKKYCNTCIHGAKCPRPCYTSMIVLSGIEPIEEKAIIEARKKDMKK